VEIASGTRESARLLASELGAGVIGLDASPHLLGRSRQKAERNGAALAKVPFSGRSCGIPLSGVAIISEKTEAASPNRLAGSLSICLLSPALPLAEQPEMVPTVH
jgi:hypothetical protein